MSYGRGGKRAATRGRGGAVVGAGRGGQTKKRTGGTATGRVTSCRRSCSGGKPGWPRSSTAKKALEQRARDKAAAAGKNEEEAKQAKPADKDQYNFTDPESRIMKGADGFVQGYNAQAAVEPERGLIVGQRVTEAANDKEQFSAYGGGDRESSRDSGPRRCWPIAATVRRKNLEYLDSAAARAEDRRLHPPASRSTESTGSRASGDRCRRALRACSG